VPVAELDRAYRRLVRGGARPTRYHSDTTAGWMASAIDPDGVWIVLSRRPTPAERRAMERVDADSAPAPSAKARPRRKTAAS